MKKFNILILISVSIFFYLKDHFNLNKKNDFVKTEYSSINKDSFLYFIKNPKLNNNRKIIYYTKHVIILDTDYKLPVYEKHELISSELKRRKDYIRTPFIQDKRYKEVTYTTSVYTGSGFDRGHLYSAESASVNSSSFVECFYTTNIIPQNSLLNRGVWKSLEEDGRNEAEKKGITILEVNLAYEFIQNKKFKVPKYLTKVYVYPDSTYKIFTFDNFKNVKVNLTEEEIMKKWN